jgi:hypothetical protein
MSTSLQACPVLDLRRTLLGSEHGVKKKAAAPFRAAALTISTIPNQFGFKQVSAMPYGLTWSGGDVVPVVEKSLASSGK